MSSASHLALIALTIAVAPVSAQTSWLGKKIIVVRDDIQIGPSPNNGNWINLPALRGLDYRVLGEKDGWIKINDGRGNVGWFDKADAVPLQDAPSYFTARIRQNPTDIPAYNGRAWASKLLGNLS